MVNLLDKGAYVVRHIAVIHKPIMASDKQSRAVNPHPVTVTMEPPALMVRRDLREGVGGFKGEVFPEAVGGGVSVDFHVSWKRSVSGVAARQHGAELLNSMRSAIVAHRCAEVGGG